MTIDKVQFAVPLLQDLVDLLLSALPETSPIQNQDEFSVWTTYVELAAQTGQDARKLISLLSPMGYVLYATGAYLDEHAAGLALSRIQERSAEGLLDVTVSQPVLIPAGHIVQTLPDGQGNVLKYIVSQDTTLTVPGGKLPVVAEETGSKYNITVANRVKTLVTVVSGVTGVTNSADWLTQLGVDTETDESLRTRCLLRWPALSNGSIKDKYILTALSVPGITKVLVRDQHPNGQGSVDVYVAPPTGMPTNEQRQEVRDALEYVRALTTNLRVLAPAPVSRDETVTIYRNPADPRTADDFEAIILAVLNSLGPGQTYYPSAVADAIYGTPKDPNIYGVVLPSLAPVTCTETQMIVPGTITVVLA
ncbi:baseplate J/gp47 family protein [Deinococcus cellulosilyticus]|uniref:Baseplate protein J-like domain-containing protein n=1 Tax=Deinococcus cellulosilyticus (strain DSM 18568 / NBRC 106333 / KACC 11606 / 5516J-15) TaxID=1223518 RepID=A0A511MW83_DEIC1|nr:baseplate J/gp47 family protein [Deinococcus cellulosilyticus]GEM44839.1 hypothetical protein DC3_04740 [Deinococcus cellulosilyticus NBRC 106333 = KACC 11606]